MANEDLISVWNDHYAEPGDTAIKDRPFFELEVHHLVEQTAEHALAVSRGPRIRLLELGCGTGFLAQRVTERLASLNIDAQYDAVDFSAAAIEVAQRRKLDSCRLVVDDFVSFLEGSPDAEYDLVLTQRSIMAVMDATSQHHLLELVRGALGTSGTGLLSEGSIQGMARLNRLRSGLGLDPIETVWHSRYIDEAELASVFSEVQIQHFAPLYWLITRVIYPHLAEPQHNTELHRFAASLPQAGDFSPVRIFVVRP